LQLADRLHIAAIKTVGQFHQRRVAALAHRIENGTHAIMHFIVTRFAPGGQCGEVGVEIQVGGIKAIDVHAGLRRASTAASIASRIGWICACRVFMLARLTIRRLEMWQISSVGSSPSARRVLPVSTISTMRSARPTNGASSIAPYNLMTSAWRPCDA